MVPVYEEYLLDDFGETSEWKEFLEKLEGMGLSVCVVPNPGVVAIRTVQTAGSPALMNLPMKLLVAEVNAQGYDKVVQTVVKSIQELEPWWKPMVRKGKGQDLPD